MHVCDSHYLMLCCLLMVPDQCSSAVIWLCWLEGKASSPVRSSAWPGIPFAYSASQPGPFSGVASFLCCCHQQAYNGSCIASGGSCSQNHAERGTWFPVQSEACRQPGAHLLITETSVLERVGVLRHSGVKLGNGKPSTQNVLKP